MIYHKINLLKIDYKTNNPTDFQQQCR